MTTGRSDPSSTDAVNESESGRMDRPDDHVVAILGSRDEVERAVRARVAVAAGAEERKVLAAHILRDHRGRTLNFIGRCARDQLAPAVAY